MSQRARFSQTALANAFQTFNQLSEQLAGSYQALEQQVSHLSDELNKTNDARLKELTEKERLANRLSTLLQALPGGVVVVDSEGLVQECNQTAIGLLGEPLKQVAWSTVIERAFAPRSDDGHDISLVDGRRVNISTCPMMNEPGQVLLITDVSEIRSLQDRLNQNERLAAMGEMAASLAHQIRTPLASAMLYTSNLKRNHLSVQEQQRFSTKIQSRLAHLERIVNDMLLYARSNSTGVEESFNMASLVDDVEHLLDAKLIDTEVDFTFIDESDDTELTGNRQMLLSAIANLCVNAIQAMDGSGCLKILSRRTDPQYLDMLVCDNGPGIPKNKLKHIFDPFYTTRQEGTGLGLAVVRAIIHAHKGDIFVDSTCGIGTTFIIRLPILKAGNQIFYHEHPAATLAAKAV